jgi:trans-aconitate methyltransferase
MTDTDLYDDTWEAWADMKTWGPASRWLRYLIRRSLTHIEPDTLSSILDVGCGEGTNTQMLAEIHPKCTVNGIDFSKTAIRLAQDLHDNSNLGFSVDIESASLNNHYDLITCFEVLEHVEDWQNLLNKMADASNRFVLLSFPMGRMRPFEKNVGHLRNFQKGEVEHFMESRGFKRKSISYAGFPFYSPFYRELCNLTDAASSSFTQGKYTYKQKIVSQIIYLSFLCSTRDRFGDQFVGLFEKA